MRHTCAYCGVQACLPVRAVQEHKKSSCASGTLTHALLQAYLLIRAAQEREEARRCVAAEAGNLRAAEAAVAGLQAELDRLAAANGGLAASLRCAQGALDKNIGSNNGFCMRSGTASPQPMAAWPPVW